MASVGQTRNWTPVGVVTFNPERDTLVRAATSEILLCGSIGGQSVGCQLNNAKRHRRNRPRSKGVSVPHVAWSHGDRSVRTSHDAAGRLADDPPPRHGRRNSAPIGIIPSARPASRRIFPTAGRWNTHRKWPRMKVRAPPNFTIGRRNGSRRMRSRGLALISGRLSVLTYER
jgi:hypothetical protein